MDIIVECKDKASLLIQRNTHLRRGRAGTVIIQLTHMTTSTGYTLPNHHAPSCWHGNNKALTHYTRGYDLVMEQMRSPKSSGWGFSRGLVVCLWTHGSYLNQRWFEPPLNYGKIVITSPQHVQLEEFENQLRIRAARRACLTCLIASSLFDAGESSKRFKLQTGVFSLNEYSSWQRKIVDSTFK